MKRWMLVLAVLGAAAMLPTIGCGDDDDTDTADVRDDARTDDGDIGAEDAPPDETVTEDAEDVPETEAEAETTDPCGATSCPNDPVDGPIGTPCLDDPDCESGFTCFAESIDVYEGEQYINDLGGYCVTWGFGAAGCDPDVASSCPNGSECIYLGENPSTGQTAYGCYDMCSAASSSGVPWTNNCDCRDGYMCLISAELCLPGCSHDRECCEIWHDGEGGAADGARQGPEMTLLGSDRCTNTCDPCTYACVNDGCPGGTCAIGDPCEHDADCPANGRCLDEYSYCDDPAEPCPWPDGMCIQDRCDLSGLECPTGSGCFNFGAADDPYYLCIQGCTAGTQPGDADYPCRDVGEPGPSEGDHACFPVFDPSADWLDGTTATGFCNAGMYTGSTGNWAGGTTEIGNDCTDSDECRSPYGLGYCIDFGAPAAHKYCTVWVNEPLAEAGGCEIDTEVGVASAVAFRGVCMESCENPNANLGAASTGCSVDWMACYPTTALTGYFYFHTGETAPAGLCHPSCTSDADCTELWGSAGIPCDEATGICDIFSK